jgi:small subunit ribosomal protein S20
VNILANIKSAIKRIKVTKIRTLRNKSIKSSVKTAIKKFEAAIAEGDLEKARNLYPQVTSSIDKAAAKGVFHKNAASRKKSKLALKLQVAQNQE